MKKMGIVLLVFLITLYMVPTVAANQEVIQVDVINRSVSCDVNRTLFLGLIDYITVGYMFDYTTVESFNIEIMTTQNLSIDIYVDYSPTDYSYEKIISDVVIKDSQICFDEDGLLMYKWIGYPERHTKLMYYNATHSRQINYTTFLTPPLILEISNIGIEEAEIDFSIDCSFLLHEVEEYANEVIVPNQEVEVVIPVINNTTYIFYPTNTGNIFVDAFLYLFFGDAPYNDSSNRFVFSYDPRLVYGYLLEKGVMIGILIGIVVAISCGFAVNKHL